MRRRLAQVISLLAAVAAAVPVVVWWDRLPAHMATHWGLGGGPNGSMSKAVAVATMTGAAVALGLAGAVLAGRLHHAAAVAAAVAALLAWASGEMAWANLDVHDWHRARHLPLFRVVPGMLLAAAVLLGVWRLLPPLLQPADPGPRPSAHLASGERAAWTATIGWSPLIPAGLLAVGVLVGLVAGVVGVPLPLVFAAAATSPFTRIRVTVDRGGVRIRYGWLPWPRTHIALERIAAAHAIDLHPMSWGGWGYRVGPGRTAVVLHAGPALQLDLTNGRKFAVTVPDPETPAGILNDLGDLSPIQ